MAILDLSTATRSLQMSDPALATFNYAYRADPTFWLFNTPAGHALRLAGNGLTYDAHGHALSGLVNTIEIDFGNDNPLNPDIRVTGISASAPRLDDGPTAFWHVLQGDDVIYGPRLAKGATSANVLLFGDAAAANAGAGRGGNDIFDAGDGYVIVIGDVEDVGSRIAGSLPSSYRGGDDEMLGLPTRHSQVFVGDALWVHAGSALTGGNDTIHTQTTFGSITAGDALYVEGAGGVLGRVAGGDDFISAGPVAYSRLVGDVFEARSDSWIEGGDDRIEGGNLGEEIVGDVYRMHGSTLVGGSDTLDGNGGNDVIVGDAFYVNSYNTVYGGHDLILGGWGDDRIWGDTHNGGGPATTGGNDRLFGEEGADWIDGEGGDDLLDGGSGMDAVNGGNGNDRIHGGAQDDNLSGGAGADRLDGGTGADRMWGGDGNDTYVVDDQLDRIYENLNLGRDTVVSYLTAYRLRGEVENVSFAGTGSFTGIGNHLNNTIQGGSSADELRGEDGHDVLIGGAGGDLLKGGAGVDTASYASAVGGVEVRLSGSGFGNHASGDRLTEIENLAGSRFNDVLHGDGGANRIAGGTGDDYLHGNGGNDILTGGAGLDILVGGVTGSDTFVFNARNEGRDTIIGFSSGVGNDDRLLFDGDAFGGLADGALAAARFVANASGVATASGHRFVYETDTGLLRFDANGSAAGGVQEIALFSEVPLLTVADFFIA